MSEDAIERMRLAALGDSKSMFYQGLVKMCRDADAQARRAKLVEKHVTVPFLVSDADQAELEQQFAVSVRARSGVVRSRLTPRVAALMMVLDAALLEHATLGGRSVLLVDGDIMTVAMEGLDGKLVERSNATARLSVGYFMEVEQLRKRVEQVGVDTHVAADCMYQEVLSGGGEHFWPVVRENGPAVDVVVVNHFKTPVGLRQAAWLAKSRSAGLVGAFPFQVEMLERKKGRLACFPGEFYVDDIADVITLVPDGDATQSLSHPYSSLMEIVQNNSVTVDGKEYLCEKYMALRGIMYYSLRAIDTEFEVLETLRTHYYDKSAAGITLIKFPKVKFSDEGVPVGMQVAEVRVSTARCEKVMTRVMTSSNEVVTPSEVFVALTDYNNMVVNSLDTAVVADRIDVEDEEDIALAIALHVNWTRHMARGTFNELMGAVRLRFAVGDTAVYRLAFVALAAWWRKPKIVSECTDEIPIPLVLDWCGNDFSVVMRDVDPWIEIAQVVGDKHVVESRVFPWFPRPPVVRDESWLKTVLKRVGLSVEPERVDRVYSRAAVYHGPLGFRAKSTAAVVVSETLVEGKVVLPELTGLKMGLLRKMMSEQAGVVEVPCPEFHVVREQINSGVLPEMPVEDVDVVSAMRHDNDMVTKILERNVVATGYRLAETDVSKVSPGCISVNDSKRAIPKPRWVRLPKVDLGVEGVRAQSQTALMAALYKRNCGIPSNRGTVNLDEVPVQTVAKVIQVCYKENWQEIVNKHLATGMWEANEADLEVFLGNIDEIKARRLLMEFFSIGSINLVEWMLLLKGKVKPSRDFAVDGKIDHAQTIMYLENSSTNAFFSAQVRRFKRCVDECMRPEVKLNAQESDVEHESWYNSLESLRVSCGKTYSYGVDIHCYDRSQEHVGLAVRSEFYRVHGLSVERLKQWEIMYGPKRAVSMMFGIALMINLCGISGVFDTLWRNGIINMAALVVSTGINREDVIMLDIKGDDVDAEFRRPVLVETAVEGMSLTYNLSAKFFTNDVRYMCKQFRIRLLGRWFFMADPWARAQSAATPQVVDGKDGTMMERWISLGADLRHYDNGLLVDEVARVAQQYYHTPVPLYGFARSLSKFVQDKGSFFSFFSSPVLVS